MRALVIGLATTPPAEGVVVLFEATRGWHNATDASRTIA